MIKIIIMKHISQHIPVFVSSAINGSKYYCYDVFQPYVDAHFTRKLSKYASIIGISTTVATTPTSVVAATTEVFIATTKLFVAPTKVAVAPTRLMLHQPVFLPYQTRFVSLRPKFISLQPSLIAQQIWHIGPQSSFFYFHQVFVSEKISNSIYTNKILFINAKIQL